ncbi:type II toxin-antitoxin system ParD family antitoxin [Rhizobium sp.]
MRTTQQYSITLPHEMAEFVEARVQSGHYASVSEVLRDGVRALLERDAVFEKWLREEAAASYDAYKADPSNVIPADQVMERIMKRARDRRA